MYIQTGVYDDVSFTHVTLVRTPSRTQNRVETMGPDVVTQKDLIPGTMTVIFRHGEDSSTNIQLTRIDRSWRERVGNVL